MNQSPPALLSDTELFRYDRQIAIPAMDIDGQEKLKLAKILVIGMGGLGCAASQYLAVAGVGQMTLVDFDTIELSNLQRQVLHYDTDIGAHKVDSAKQSLALMNPHLQIETINTLLDEDALAQQVSSHTLVLDCTDNIKVREQLNRACFKFKVPLVSAAAIRMEGMVTLFDYEQQSPCYHCYSQFFGEQQLSCVESGILAPVVGMIGCIQATEVIKALTGMGNGLAGRLLMIDAMTMEFREISLPKQANCAVCS